MKQYHAKSLDDVLTKPGLFGFQIEEDNTYKHSKNFLPFTDNVIKTIHHSIINTFRRIEDNIKPIIAQSPDYLSKIVSKLSKYINNRHFRFPGLQVINLNRKLLDFFTMSPDRFLICEKSDGVRFLFLQFLNGRTMLVGRNMEFYQVNLCEKFPQSRTGTGNDWELVHFLDGELIVDKCNHDGSNDSMKKSNIIECNMQYYEVKFLIFDAIVINEENIGALPFKQRLSRLSLLFKGIEFERFSKISMRKYQNQYEQEIIMSSFLNSDLLNPHLMPATNSQGQSFQFSIEVYMKDYFTMDQIDKLYSLAKSLPHENDGVIINTDDYPYYSGQSTEIFKWKPSDMNTIDFEVIRNNSKELFELHIKDVNTSYPVSCLFFKDSNEFERFKDGWSESNPNVAECFYDKNLDTKDSIIFNYYFKKYQQSATSHNIKSMFANYNKNIIIDENIRKHSSKGGWRFMRYRKDKGQANFVSTYENILNVIEENIQMNDIVEYIMRNKERPNIKMENMKNFCSAALWFNFYNERNDNDYDLYNNGFIEQDPLLLNINQQLSSKSENYGKSPEKQQSFLTQKRDREINEKKTVQFNVNQSSTNYSSNQTNKKVELQSKAQLTREIKEKKKIEKTKQFSESLNLLNSEHNDKKIFENNRSSLLFYNNDELDDNNGFKGFNSQTKTQNLFLQKQNSEISLSESSNSD